MTEKHRLSMDAFFKAEYKKLIHYVRKNMEDRFIDTSPEDIIQDVALSLLAKLDVNVQIENLGGYIYRSLKNRIIDSQRKPNKNVRIENMSDRQAENLLTYDISNEEEFEESSMKKISADVLHNAIGQLKPDEQAIIMLTEFENRTFEELARKWNIPVGTLLSRKYRALSKLNKILTKTENANTNKKKDYGNKRNELEKKPVSW
jgi:RNA polymerase sigma factor (sigma-70 family)